MLRLLRLAWFYLQPPYSHPALYSLRAAGLMHYTA